MMIKLKDLIIESIDSDEVAGVVYIVNKESFLCLKRSDNNQEWSIPKGHIHIDEEPIDGAIRELSEETQLILPNKLELFKSYKNFHLFICHGEKELCPRLNHEHVDWKYQSINHYPDNFDSKHGKYIKELISGI